MSRLNLTLDEGTLKSLARHSPKRPVASFARQLIEEGLARLEREARLKKLARDYAAGRDDARELLADFEPLALETLESLDD